MFLASADVVEYFLTAFRAENSHVKTLKISRSVVPHEHVLFERTHGDAQWSELNLLLTFASQSDQIGDGGKSRALPRSLNFCNQELLQLHPHNICSRLLLNQYEQISRLPFAHTQEFQELCKIVIAFSEVTYELNYDLHFKTCVAQRRRLDLQRPQSLRVSASPSSRLTAVESGKAQNDALLISVTFALQPYASDDSIPDWLQVYNMIKTMDDPSICEVGGADIDENARQQEWTKIDLSHRTLPFDPDLQALVLPGMAPSGCSAFRSLMLVENLEGANTFSEVEIEPLFFDWVFRAGEAESERYSQIILPAMVKNLGELLHAGQTTFDAEERLFTVHIKKPVWKLKFSRLKICVRRLSGRWEDVLCSYFPFDFASNEPSISDPLGSDEENLRPPRTLLDLQGEGDQATALVLDEQATTFWSDYQRLRLANTVLQSKADQSELLVESLYLPSIAESMASICFNLCPASLEQLVNVIRQSDKDGAVQAALLSGHHPDHPSAHPAAHNEDNGEVEVTEGRTLGAAVRGAGPWRRAVPVLRRLAKEATGDGRDSRGTPLESLKTHIPSEADLDENRAEKAGEGDLEAEESGEEGGSDRGLKSLGTGWRDALSTAVTSSRVSRQHAPPRGRAASRGRARRQSRDAGIQRRGSEASFRNGGTRLEPAPKRRNSGPHGKAQNTSPPAAIGLNQQRVSPRASSSDGLSDAPSDAWDDGALGTGFGSNRRDEEGGGSSAASSVSDGDRTRADGRNSRAERLRNTAAWLSALGL